MYAKMCNGLSVLCLYTFESGVNTTAARVHLHIQVHLLLEMPPKNPPLCLCSCFHTDVYKSTPSSSCFSLSEHFKGKHGIWYSILVENYTFSFLLGFFLKCNQNHDYVFSYCATGTKTTNKFSSCIRKEVPQIKLSCIINSKYLICCMNFKYVFPRSIFH